MIPWPKFTATSFFETRSVFRRFRAKEPHHAENVYRKKCYLYRKTRRIRSVTTCNTTCASYLVRYILKDEKSGGPLPLSSSSSLHCVAFHTGIYAMVYIYIHIYPCAIVALLGPAPSRYSRNLDSGSQIRPLLPPSHYGTCFAFCFAGRVHPFLPSSSTSIEICIPTL